MQFVTKKLVAILFGFWLQFLLCWGNKLKGGKERKKERERETSFFQGQDMLLADPCRCCNQKVAGPEANPHMLRMSTRALCSIFYVPTYFIPTPSSTLVTYILFYLFIYL